MQQLKQYLNSIHPISEEAWPKIAILFKKETYAKGADLVLYQPFEKTHTLFFSRNGPEALL